MIIVNTRQVVRQALLLYFITQVRGITLIYLKRACKLT